MTPEELEAKKAEIRAMKAEAQKEHEKLMAEVSEVKKKGGDYQAVIDRAKKQAEDAKKK